MIILGLSVFADSSAAIIKDGEILAAVEEERLNSIKHYEGLPRLSIAECLDIAGLEYKEIDKLAIGWNPLKGWTRRICISLLSTLGTYKKLNIKFTRGGNYIKRCKDIILLNNILKEDLKQSFSRKKIIFVKHHLAHSASAFFTSPYSEANIIVADGIGESETISFFKGSANNITKIKSIKYPDSLGHLYASVTGFLGFKMTSDEGKVMALASFGEDTYRELFEEILKTDYENGKFHLDIKLLDYHLAREGIFSDGFIKKTNLKPRRKEEPLNQKHKNLACSLQKCIERNILSLLKKYFPEGRGKSLCAAGGLFLNSVLNGKIMSDFTDKFYVFPAAGDNGVSVGSAMYLCSRNNNCFNKRVLNNVSLGKLFSKEDIKRTISSVPLMYHDSSDIYLETANLLIKGNIIGWFSGRMEFGPRALGNRSILASPLLNSIKNKLNRKIKHREEFRPFACSVLSEEANDYFESFTDSPFMLKVFRFKEHFRNKFPAVNHIDGTCRIQVVSRQNNEHYYNLLLKMRELTGYGMVLNTSMNVNGQPIVNSPEQAMELLLSTDIDAMVFDKYIVRKN